MLAKPLLSYYNMSLFLIIVHLKFIEMIKNRCQTEETVQEIQSLGNFLKFWFLKFI
jgi:hypothetical protein